MLGATKRNKENLFVFRGFQVAYHLGRVGLHLPQRFADEAQKVALRLFGRNELESPFFHSARVGGPWGSKLSRPRISEFDLRPESRKVREHFHLASLGRMDILSPGGCVL